MTNIKIVSKLSTLLTVTTAIIVLPLLACNKVFASVDHLMDFHLEVPEVFQERERDRAERDSERDGYSHFQDNRGNDHHYVDGKEVS